MVFFMADKTEPSSYSLPLCRTFMDPFTTTGLVIDLAPMRASSSR